MFDSPTELEKEMDKRLLSLEPLLNIVNRRLTMIETKLIEDMDSTGEEMAAPLRKGYWEYWTELRALSTRCWAVALSGQMSTGT